MQRLQVKLASWKYKKKTYVTQKNLFKVQPLIFKYLVYQAYNWRKQEMVSKIENVSEIIEVVRANFSRMLHIWITILINKRIFYIMHSEKRLVTRRR